MAEIFEKYIKDLSPELQEKAKDIKTVEQAMEFAAENDIELPEEALDMVSGGACHNSKKYCNVCGAELDAETNGSLCPDCQKKLSDSFENKGLFGGG